MHVRRVLIFALVILAALTVVGSAAAQDSGSEEPPGLDKILDKIETVVFDYVLARGGLIVVGIGAAAWALGTSGDTVQKGKKFMMGGFVMVVFGVAPSKIASLIEWFGNF